MPESIEDIQRKLSQVLDRVSWIQIDLCDGDFVRKQTWPYNGSDDLWYEKILAEEEGLPFWDRFNFEFDLMVRNARNEFDTFLRLGARRIVFHLEAEDDTDAFLEFLEGIDLYVRENTEIGVAIDMATPLDTLTPFIQHIDFVQLMGIDEIGKQGEPIDEKVYDHIRKLRSIYPDLTISIDGGVNFDTAPLLADAGANRLVIGSAIWKSGDVEETISEFESI